MEKIEKTCYNCEFCMKNHLNGLSGCIKINKPIISPYMPCEDWMPDEPTKLILRIEKLEEQVEQLKNTVTYEQKVRIWRRGDYEVYGDAYPLDEIPVNNKIQCTMWDYDAEALDKNIWLDVKYENDKPYVVVPVEDNRHDGWVVTLRYNIIKE